MQVGIQEKVQFVAAAKKLAGSGLFNSVIRLPAAIEVFLVLVGVAVFFHHVPAADTRRNTDSLLPDVLSDAA